MKNPLAIVGDIHLGIKSDSSDFHEVHTEFFKWTRELFLDNGVNTVIQLGDWWHNRNEINVKTLNVGLECQKLWSPFTQISIIGNHDTYYKTTNDVTSMNIFASNQNLVVISKPVEIKLFGDKEALFVPWIVNITSFIDFLKHKNKTYDYMFGHFEVDGGLVSRNAVIHSKLKATDLTQFAKKIFSGHFHIRRMDGEIMYVGAAMPLTWGDVNETSCVHLLHEDGSVQEFKNEISPMFIEIVLSELVKTKQFPTIKNNHVRLVVDIKIAEDKLNKLIDIIKQKLPQSFISIYAGYQLEVDAQFSTEKISDPLTMIDEYIGAVEIGEHMNIDKKELTRRAHELFNIALQEQ